MGFAYSRDKDSVICVNGPAKSQGGVNPRDVSIALMCSINVDPFENNDRLHTSC